MKKSEAVFWSCTCVMQYLRFLCTCTRLASFADCRYDPRTDTWTNVACMSIGRDAIGVGVLGDKLLAVGGYDGQSYLRIVEAYDPHLNAWTQVSNFNNLFLLIQVKLYKF